MKPSATLPVFTKWFKKKKKIILTERSYDETFSEEVAYCKAIVV